MSATSPDPGSTVAVSLTDQEKTSRLQPAALVAAETRRTRPSLGTRFFVQAAALLGVTLGVAIGFASWQVNRLATRRIAESLDAVPEIFAGYVDSESATRRAAVRARAEDAGTKALLAEKATDPASLRDTAAEFATGLGADKVFFLGETGRLLSRSDRAAGEDAGRDFSKVRWVAEPLTSLADASAFILDLKPAPKLSLVASAPVTQGSGGEMKLNGVIAAAFLVDDRAALRLARLTGAETALVANVAADGQPLALGAVAATARLGGSPLASALATRADVTTPIFTSGTKTAPFDVVLGGERYLGVGIPIKAGAGNVIAALLVLKSRSAELEAFRKTRDGLIGIGVVLLLVSLPVSFATARRISQPIEQLAEVANAIRSGRLDQKLPADSGDEVGALARAFRRMVDDLKEKAALEALVADLQRRPGDVTLATFTGSGTLSGTMPGPAGGATGDGPRVGRLFAGRYEMLSVLGEGGMGRVFRARDRELDDEIALKVLGGDLAGPSPIQGLKDELRIARKITHPNVVRVHDLGESGGLAYITMEYVPGTTLRELLSARRSIGLAPGLQLAKQICRGLAAVHEAGIIHRDLKPHNVMVMANGVVKLMDFGIARTSEASGAVGGETEGTPLYMSPEQLRGETLDARADLYAAALVMFEIFAGRHAFLATDIHDVIQRQLFEVPASLRSVRPDAPETLAAILSACLAKEREKRPRSAVEVERALATITV